MPIKPENKERYPANWSTEIVPRIRKRSGNRCERCHVPNKAVILRGEYNYREAYQDDNGDIYAYPSGKYLGSDYVGEVATDDYAKAIRIVLTVAHLDHNPENCSDDNLAHLCQKCHNGHDAEHRKKTRSHTRAETKSQGNLQIQFQ